MSDRDTDNIDLYMRYCGVISLLARLYKHIPEGIEDRYPLDLAFTDFRRHNKEHWEVKQHKHGWMVEPKGKP